jgi:hypothetical protein
MTTHADDRKGANVAERFRVGAEVNGVHGGGTLWVSPGLIVLETDRPTRLLSRVSRVAHTDSDVVLVTARLVPPWFNVSVALHDGSLSVRVVTWMLGRARLRDALRRNGFDVREAATLFSRNVGVTEDRSAELPAAPQPWWLSRRTRVSAAIVSVVVAGAMVMLVSQSPLFIAVLAAAVAANFAAVILAVTD